MIEVDIRLRLSAADAQAVESLCESAANNDAEAGFTRIDAEKAAAVDTAKQPCWRVVVRYKNAFGHHPELPFEVAAYGMLEEDAAEPRLGWLRYVVMPELRALGITTMVAETVGVGKPGSGLLDELPFDEVRWWAYASHPAADRFARRFGLRVVEETWRVVGAVRGPLAIPLERHREELMARGTRFEMLPVSGDEAATELAGTGLQVTANPRFSLDDLRALEGASWLLARDAAGAAVGFAVGLPEGRHRDGRTVASVLEVGCAPGERTLRGALLVEAAIRLRDAGAEMVDLHLNPADEIAVSTTRHLGLEVADVHTCYGWTRTASDWHWRKESNAIRIATGAHG